VGAVVRPVEPDAGVLRQISEGHVRLAQQDRVAGAPLEILAPVVENGEVHRARIVAGGNLFQDKRGGVDAEPGDTHLQPEAHHFLDLVADRGVTPVQVRLEVVEAVVVPLAGRVVVAPGFGLLAGKHDALPTVRWFLFAPDVPVAVGRRRAGAGGLEPGVLVGGVVDHQVDDDPDAPFPGLQGELCEIA
jgi:hypothetical protein